MAPTKRARGSSRSRGRAPSGRVTPKAKVKPGRYTPPIPREVKVSAPWVPWVMFGLLISGMLVIVTNYLSIPPGSPSNWYLLAGLGLITAGFITATRYR